MPELNDYLKNEREEKRYDTSLFFRNGTYGT